MRQRAIDRAARDAAGGDEPDGGTGGGDAADGSMPPSPAFPRKRSRSFPGLDEGESEIEPALRPTYTPAQRAHHRMLGTVSLVAWTALCGGLHASGISARHAWMPLCFWLGLWLFYGFNVATPRATLLFWGGYEHLNEGKLKQGKWVNTCVSLAHSTIMSVLSFASMAQWWLQDGAPPLLASSTHVLPYATIGVTVGYFGYDMYDMLQSGLYVKDSHIVLHHFAMITVFVLGGVLDIGPQYLIYTLCCESNSVFLHLRTLLQMAGHTLSSGPYKATWSALWVTMVLTRCIPHSALVWYLWRDRDNWAVHGTPLYVTGFVCLLVFNALNFKLVMDCMTVYRRDQKLVRKPSSSASSSGSSAARR